MVRDVKVTRFGSGVTGIVTFEGVADTNPSLDEIATAQIEAGYHPTGYGGPNSIRVIPRNDGWYITWTCHASCD